jgi:DUF2934 family protein
MSEAVAKGEGMAELPKFDELRARTDRELAQLINSELDLGVCEAREALSAGTWAFAEGHYVRAQRAYARALRLIPLIDEIPVDERGPEERLEHLREMLDGLSVLGSTPTPTKETITPLARALWKARGCPEGSPEDDWLRAEQALKSQRELHAACC